MRSRRDGSNLFRQRWDNIYPWYGMLWSGGDMQNKVAFRLGETYTAVSTVVASSMLNASYVAMGGKQTF